MATHVLKLQYGADKRSPTRTLDLLTSSGSGPYLRLSGFAPGAGTDNVIWSGQTALSDGQRFIDSTRDNVTFTITYDLSATSPAELTYHQRQISRFIQDTKLWYRDRIGAPVYLRYRWGEGLSALSEPVFGQFSYFYKVLYAEVESWPGGLHTGALVANYIESVELTLVCEPYAEGLQQQAGHADGLPDTDSDVTVAWTMSGSEFNGSYTIAGWITHAASDYFVLEYFLTLANYINVFWDESDSRYEINSRVSSITTVTNGNSQSLNAGDKVHIALTQASGGSTTLYVNGTEQTNNGSANAWANSGTLTLGAASSSAPPPAQTAGLDAWRVWTSELSAANITSLYNAEEPIKTAGDTISPPPYLKTRSGDGVFENVDGVLSAAEKDNWGVAGWVPGDAPAKTVFHIDPTSATAKQWWIGRRAAKNTFTPKGTLWLEYNGTANFGGSSDDEAEIVTTSGSGTDTHEFDAAITDTEQARGRFVFLARFRTTGSGADVEPYFKLGLSDRVKGDVVTVENNASVFLRNFGDWTIDWPGDDEAITLEAGLFCTETAASASTLFLDFLQLMPYPNVNVRNENASPSYASGDYIVIDGLESWAADSSDSNSQLNKFTLTGNPITLIPNYYNYIFLLQGSHDESYAVSDSNTVTLFVTPRYQLPGGLR